MQFADVALGQRNHAHAGKGQSLVDAGDVLLIP